MLTIAAALLLGRADRLLMHSAAVVDPSGGAWLLTGDARSGKSTSTANLIRAGWSWLSDDQVVLGCVGGDLVVEGWPRPFHLDTGWEDGSPTGLRATVDADSFGSGRWRRSAPLAGLLFPEVQAKSNTALMPVSRAEALTRLLRQSPWLLADRASAPSLLGLLERTAVSPAHRLVLAMDTFRDGSRLARILLHP
jgi:hypothetical protein